MFVGSVGLKFANFSARNIFNKEAWRPLPSGDGQTLSLRYQTSGQYYKTASLSFYEPWLGGKKPNSFSLSFSWSRVNFSANKYYQNYYNSPYGYGGYSPYGYGGYSPYGYGYGYGGYSPYGYGGYSPFGYSGYGSYYGVMADTILRINTTTNRKIRMNPTTRSGKPWRWVWDTATGCHGPTTGSL